MKRYIAKRLLMSLLTVLIVMVLNFFLIHLAPGDPIRIMAGMDHPNSAQLEELRVLGTASDQRATLVRVMTLCDA